MAITRQCRRNFLFSVLCVIVTVLCFYECFPHFVPEIFLFSLETADIKTPLCSLAVFTEYLNTEDADNFPGGGGWRETGRCARISVPPRAKVAFLPAHAQNRTRQHEHCHQIKQTVDLTFFPDICRFKYGRILPSNYLNHCPSFINNILVLGDSNGRRYFDALLRVISKSPYMECRSVKEEKQEVVSDYKVDMEYFRKSLPPHVRAQPSLDRRCHTCGGKKVRCAYRQGHISRDITLEYVTLLHLKDNNFRLTEVLSTNNTRRIFYPEFLFRYYLNGSYPDLVVLEAPFLYEKFQGSVSRVVEDMTYFFRVLDSFLPGSTKFLVLPSTIEQELFRSETKPPRRYARYDGYLGNEMIERLNKELYKYMLPRLKNGTSNYHGFFDLGRISGKVSDVWTGDPSHFFNIFYEKIISQVIQLLCTNS